MSVYSVRLFVGPVPSTWTSVFTAPAGTTVIRDLEVTANAAGPLTFQASILASSGSLSAIWLSVPSLAANTSHQWEGRIVLLEGDQIYLNGNSGTGGVIISGYDLGT